MRYSSGRNNFTACSLIARREEMFFTSKQGYPFCWFGKAFTVREGKWIGATVGIFCSCPQASNDSGYADVDWMGASQLVAIDDLFTALEAKNTTFKTLFESRNTEYSEREKGSGTSLKPAAVEGYIQFCNALEQAANFTPNADIIALFNKLDELRKKYHGLDGSGGKDTPPVDEVPVK